MWQLAENRLLEYVRENNPELQLQPEEGVVQCIRARVAASSDLFDSWDKDMPAYMMEAACMEILTADLRPSRFNYLKEILETEFEAAYSDFIELGVLVFETINLVQYCESIFDDAGFSEANEDDPFLLYQIIGAVREYLDSVNEKVSNELQAPTKTSG